MADIINLNKARKARTRAEEDRTAAANRVRFGRTRAEKAAARAEEALAGRRLDALKRERPPEDR